MGIPLLTGRPQDGWASFSRFVLPFAYRLERRATRDLCALLPALQSEPGSWDHLARWEAVDLARERMGEVDLRARVDYFTAETAEVLFGQRTRRFRLACPSEPLEAAPVIVDADSVQVAARLQPPELILFEFDVDDQDPDSPLHMGLLIHTVYFDAALDSAQLYAFNECFRNLRKPYPGYKPAVECSQIGWLKRLAKRCIAPACRAGCEGEQRLWHDLLDAPLAVDGAAYQLYSLEASTQARHPEIGLDTQVRTPMIHADYRAHTWSAAVSKRGGSDLGPGPMLSNGWLRLLNVDGPGSDPDSSPVDSEFQQKWLADHTYQRWLSKGTLYGFTPHSGAAWLSSYPGSPLHQHFHTLYFDQLTLMLYLRSALFGFSREISLLTRRMQRRGTSGTREFARLERQFSLFTNLYQFPLLSHQQQALEMYALLRDALDIDDFYKEVQDELRHMAETFDRRHDRQVRIVGIGFAVLASAGVVWDSFNLDEWAATHGLPACLGVFGLIVGVYLSVRLVLRVLDRRD